MKKLLLLAIGIVIVFLYFAVPVWRYQWREYHRTGVVPTALPAATEKQSSIQQQSQTTTKSPSPPAKRVSGEEVHRLERRKTRAMLKDSFAEMCDDKRDYSADLRKFGGDGQRVADEEADCDIVINTPDDDPNLVLEGKSIRRHFVDEFVSQWGESGVLREAGFVKVTLIGKSVGSRVADYDVKTGTLTWSERK